MRRRQARIEQIRAIEREHQVASISAGDLEQRLRSDPSALTGEGLRFQDFQHFLENLEATYLIRMFAEFESGLRESWSLAFGQSTHPRVSDLIESLYARCNIPDEWRLSVHDVREYRNRLVHERAGEVLVIGIKDARRSLCRFFSLLPLDW